MDILMIINTFPRSFYPFFSHFKKFMLNSSQFLPLKIIQILISIQPDWAVEDFITVPQLSEEFNLGSIKTQYLALNPVLQFVIQNFATWQTY